MLPNIQVPIPYCDFLDMENILSAAGMNLRNDDNPPTVWGNSIAYATSEINRYLLRRYDMNVLAVNFWVSQQAAIGACWKLCKRRGNKAPAGLNEDWKGENGVIAALKEIRQGLADVPDAPARRQACPVMSNVFVAVSPEPHVRVRRALSTTTGGAPTAYLQFRDWSEMTELSWLNYPMG